MIFNLGTLSVWAGNIPLKKNSFLPRFSYLDGGSYWKLSFLWFKFLLEFSGPKEDNTIYKEVSKQELDKILLEHSTISQTNENYCYTRHSSEG